MIGLLDSFETMICRSLCFGYGDCTGGAQASFVTHPLAQTYYFTGTKMPFAGQTVIESNLPFTCLMSNYLSVKAGAMAGMVKHPFSEDLDNQLQSVDPALPMPTETIEQVVERIMSGSLSPSEPVVKNITMSEAELIRPDKTHANSCTRLYRGEVSF